jgi:hypothetical protein
MNVLGSLHELVFAAGARGWFDLGPGIDVWLHRAPAEPWNGF